MSHRCSQLKIRAFRLETFIEHPVIIELQSCSRTAMTLPKSWIWKTAFSIEYQDRYAIGNLETMLKPTVWPSRTIAIVTVSLFKKQINTNTWFHGRRGTSTSNEEKGSFDGVNHLSIIVDQVRSVPSVSAIAAISTPHVTTIVSVSAISSTVSTTISTTVSTTISTIVRAIAATVNVAIGATSAVSVPSTAVVVSLGHCETCC